ncbi:hypothetical protein ACFQ9X_50045 [Catenulispora yoronensis]
MYLIGGVALAVLVAATGLTYLQARRLTKPLEELAATAERLGSGDPRRGTAATASASWTGSPR